MLTYADYVRHTWYDESREWNIESNLGVRPEFIGDPAVLAVFMAACNGVLLRDPAHPATTDEMVELQAAEEAVYRSLGAQAERVIAGDEPTLIDEATVAELTSSVSITRAWYREMGLADDEPVPQVDHPAPA